MVCQMCLLVCASRQASVHQLFSKHQWARSRALTILKGAEMALWSYHSEYKCHIFYEGFVKRSLMEQHMPSHLPSDRRGDFQHLAHPSVALDPSASHLRKRRRSRSPVVSLTQPRLDSYSGLDSEAT